MTYSEKTSSIPISRSCSWASLVYCSGTEQCMNNNSVIEVPGDVYRSLHQERIISYWFAVLPLTTRGRSGLSLGRNWTTVIIARYWQIVRAAQLRHSQRWLWCSPNVKFADLTSLSLKVKSIRPFGLHCTLFVALVYHYFPGIRDETVWSQALVVTHCTSSDNRWWRPCSNAWNSLSKSASRGPVWRDFQNLRTTAWNSIASSL